MLHLVGHVPPFVGIRRRRAHHLRREVDTLVLAQGHEPVDTLADGLAGLDVEVHIAGDCLGPRTAGEAVFEGLKVATSL